MPSPYELLRRECDRLVAQLASERKLYAYHIQLLTEEKDELNNWYITRRIATPDGVYPLSEARFEDVREYATHLEKELDDLKESVRPKKKIEFVRLLHSENMTAVHGGIPPERYDSIEVLFSYPNYDVMKATHSNTNDSFIYLGHFNDGIK